MLSAKQFKVNGFNVRKTTVMKCIVERLQALNVYVQTHHTALSASCPGSAKEKKLLPRFFPAKNDFAAARWLCPSATEDEVLFSWELAVAAVKGEIGPSDVKGELEAVMSQHAAFLTRWGDWPDSDKLLYTLGRIMELAAARGIVTTNGDRIAVALRKGGPVLHLSNTRVWLPDSVMHTRLPVRSSDPYDPFHWEATSVPADLCGTGVTEYLHNLTGGDDVTMCAWHGLRQAFVGSVREVQARWWDYVKTHPPSPRECRRYEETKRGQGIEMTCAVRRSLTADDIGLAVIDVRRMLDIVVNTMKVCSESKFYEALGRPTKEGMLAADLIQRRTIATAMGLPYEELPSTVYRGSEYKMPANRWVLTHERPVYGIPKERSNP